MKQMKLKTIFKLMEMACVMFDDVSTVVRGGKASTVKQKLRELKKMLDLRLQKKKVSKKINRYETIKKSLDNTNSQSTTKQKKVSNDIEKNTLSFRASRERFNFSRL